jgi:DNA (cytosine-5)-methyltransferase 1
MKKISKVSPTALDLFCGCGGFSLGIQRAGFRVVAAIDFNKEAIDTYKVNLPKVECVLERDLTEFGPSDLAEMIGTTNVDLIIGGPPCQGFSIARRRDGANHGNDRLVDDDRRHLYQEYLRYVAFFKPKAFVMENVVGIRSAGGGEYFTKVQNESRKLGYRVHAQVEDSWEIGIPQKRKRQLVIGVRADLDGYMHASLVAPKRSFPRPVLAHAICDLPSLRAGEGRNEAPYDIERRKAYLKRYGDEGTKYLYKVLEVEKSPMLKNHVARPHSARDLRDFSLLLEGESSAVAMRERGIKFEFPYDKSSFKDRYTRQKRSGPCSTIVAHLSKDGLMFIHPKQNRSLTPREAARVQSFPDWFSFPDARTHAFRLIGNAVPPIIAEAVGITVRQFIRDVESANPTKPIELKERHLRLHTTNPSADLSNVKAATFARAFSRDASIGKLAVMMSMSRISLRNLQKADFVEGWESLLFLFPDLHPNNALDHGGSKEESPELTSMFPELPADRLGRYMRSGWPVALDLIGREAWRRLKSGAITQSEFYCVSALRAASKNRTLELTKIAN